MFIIELGELLRDSILDNNENIRYNFYSFDSVSNRFVDPVFSVMAIRRLDPDLGSSHRGQT